MTKVKIPLALLATKGSNFAVVDFLISEGIKFKVTTRLNDDNFTDFLKPPWSIRSDIDGMGYEVIQGNE
jgi:hypothetical protein